MSAASSSERRGRLLEVEALRQVRDRGGDHDDHARAARRAGAGARASATARSSAIPNASAPTRAAAMHAGRQHAADDRKRSRISGVSAETMPIAPTAAAAHASSDSGLGRTQPHAARVAQPLSGGLYIQDAVSIAASPTAPLPRWLVPLLALTAPALLPWTLWLTFSLPSRHVTQHYDLAWVGFDVALLVAFAVDGACCASRSSQLARARCRRDRDDAALRRVVRRRHVAAPGERLEAVLEAALAELPLAAICWFIVYDVERFRRDVLATRLVGGCYGED